MKLHAIETQRLGRQFQSRFAQINPRPPVLREPAPCPGSELARVFAGHVTARITEEAVQLVIRHIELRTRVERFVHDDTSALLSTGANWQPLTKKSKKPGCVSSRQCCTRRTSCSNSARLVRES